MRQALIPVFIEVDASGTVTSGAIPALNLLYLSAQLVAASTAEGTLKIQFSNDVVNPTLNITEPTNWSDIPDASVAITAPGVFAIPKIDLCYEYIQLIWTPAASDPGTISVNLKVIGV